MVIAREIFDVDVVAPGFRLQRQYERAARHSLYR